MNVSAAAIDLIIEEKGKTATTEPAVTTAITFAARFFMTFLFQSFGIIFLKTIFKVYFTYAYLPSQYLYSIHTGILLTFWSFIETEQSGRHMVSKVSFNPNPYSVPSSNSEVLTPGPYSDVSFLIAMLKS